MVDCRSLIEFCKAFDQHRNTPNSSPGVSNRKKNENCPNNFCEEPSPFAAIDIVLLLLVLGAVGVLTVPYFKFIIREAVEIVPSIFIVIGDLIGDASAAYVVSLFLGFVLVIALWEILNMKSRKCGSPYCKGLRKAVEFDIQLESEQCVKYMPPLPIVQPLDLGQQDLEELEAELKKMAPPNGRTVLIFRSPCGCPSGRMEVWGPKKLRRIKK